MISENLNKIRSEIQEAQKSSPFRQEVTLIAVSKTKPCEAVLKAYNCGQRDFGENKVQELLDKYDKLPSDIRWHLIGHLQHNKVKYIVDKVYMIHSVDSLKLAEEIERQAEKKDVTVNILIQVNVSGEESKFGIAPESAQELANAVSGMKHLKLKGLMTIAPYTENPEEIRYVFRDLKKLSIDIKGLNNDNNSVCLSMGMSGDFHIAIEEGANLVRIGSRIFGERDYGNNK
mgnify:CR=1 FL=1